MRIRDNLFLLVAALAGCAAPSPYLDEVRAADALRNSGNYAAAAEEYERLAIKYSGSRGKSSLLWLHASHAWNSAGNTVRAQQDRAMWEGLTNNAGSSQPSPSPMPMSTPYQAPAAATSKNRSSGQYQANTYAPAGVNSYNGNYGGGNGNSRASAGSQDPFLYADGVNNCLVTEPNPAIKGTSRWRNQCGFKINITFCSIRNNRNECAMRLTGGSSLEAGATAYLLRDERSNMYIACQDPYYIPSSKLTWSGERFSGRCQKNR